MGAVVRRSAATYPVLIVPGRAGRSCVGRQPVDLVPGTATSGGTAPPSTSTIAHIRLSWTTWYWSGRMRSTCSTTLERRLPDAGSQASSSTRYRLRAQQLVAVIQFRQVHYLPDTGNAEERSRPATAIVQLVRIRQSVNARKNAAYSQGRVATRCQPKGITIKSIAWATDGSPSARQAFTVAKELARAHESRLLILHVQETGITRAGLLT